MALQTGDRKCHKICPKITSSVELYFASKKKRNTDAVNLFIYSPTKETVHGKNCYIFSAMADNSLE
jgi:hypothetical protein